MSDFHKRMQQWREIIDEADGHAEKLRAEGRSMRPGLNRSITMMAANFMAWVSKQASIGRDEEGW